MFVSLSDYGCICQRVITTGDYGGVWLLEITQTQGQRLKGLRSVVQTSRPDANWC